MFVYKLHTNKMYILTIYFIICAGCGGQIYKVAPLPADNHPPPVNNNGLAVIASIIDGDQSLEQFDVHLPAAGVVPIYVHIANRSDQTLYFNHIHFTLKDINGKSLNPVSPKRALAKVIKFYGIDFYTLEARRNTENSYETISMKYCSMIGPYAECRGILFFESKNKPANTMGLTLHVSDIKAGTEKNKVTKRFALNIPL